MKNYLVLNTLNKNGRSFRLIYDIYLSIYIIVVVAVVVGHVNSQLEDRILTCRSFPSKNNLSYFTQEFTLSETVLWNISDSICASAHVCRLSQYTALLLNYSCMFGPQLKLKQYYCIGPFHAQAASWVVQRQEVSQNRRWKKLALQFKSQTRHNVLPA